MNKLPNKDFYNFQLYTNLPDKTWLDAIDQPQQSTVVIIKEANPTTLALLKKILGAVQQDLHQDCLVLQQEKAVAFKDLLQGTAVKRLLVFGWTASEMGLHLLIKPYQLVNFAGVQLLFSHSLKVIAANQNKEKQQLWTQLQQLF